MSLTSDTTAGVKPRARPSAAPLYSMLELEEVESDEPEETSAPSDSAQQPSQLYEMPDGSKLDVKASGSGLQNGTEMGGGWVHFIEAHGISFYWSRREERSQ